MLKLIEETVEQSRIEIKVNKGFVIEELEELAGEKTSDSVKCFCIFYQKLRMCPKSAFLCV